MHETVNLNGGGALTNSPSQPTGVLRYYDPRKNRAARGQQRFLCASHPVQIQQRNEDPTGLPGGRSERGLAVFREALEIHRELHERNPDDRTLEHDLAAAHNRIGAALEQAGDHVGAVDSFRRSVAVKEKFLEHSPLDSVMRANLAGGYAQLTSALLELHEFVEADDHAVRNLETIAEVEERGSPLSFLRVQVRAAIEQFRRELDEFEATR